MYQFSDRVRFSELDENAQMTLPAVMNLLQDCSDYHSEELGIGHAMLEEHGCAWVLSFWQVLIERYPRGRERFTAETRPWKFEHCFGYRNFALYDEAGEAMVKANSLWTFLDVRRQRPVRPLPEVLEGYGVDERLEMDYTDSRKIRLPEERRALPSFPVRRSHLDMNHHVNNVQYIAMACDVLPPELVVCELRAEYRRAARLGDVITPVVAEADGWHIVALCDDAGRPYALVEARGERQESAKPPLRVEMGTERTKDV